MTIPPTSTLINLNFYSLTGHPTKPWLTWLVSTLSFAKIRSRSVGARIRSQYFQSTSWISGSSHKSIIMEWC